MTEEMYFKLLEKSRDFCKHIKVDYLDFLHDVICEEPIVNENNVKKIFSKKGNEIVKQRRLRKVIAYDFQREYAPRNDEKSYRTVKQISLYRYCKHCDMILPESVFYTASSGSPMTICKEGWLEKQRVYKKSRKDTRNRTEYQKEYREKKKLKKKVA